jgi:hypothetical protein
LIIEADADLLVLTLQHSTNAEIQTTAVEAIKEGKEFRIPNRANTMKGRRGSFKVIRIKKQLDEETN